MLNHHYFGVEKQEQREEQSQEDDFIEAIPTIIKSEVQKEIEVEYKEEELHTVFCQTEITKEVIDQLREEYVSSLQ